MTARSLTPPGRALLLALAALLLVLLPAQGAQAHAALVATDPADGAALDAMPSTVTLSFNEPVQPIADAVHLIVDGGAAVPVEAAARDDDIVVTMPADLADGAYFLNWRVISTDAHPISGVLAFTVGDAAPAPAPADQGGTDERPVAVMTLNALHYLGLLVFAGFLFFKIAIAPPQPGRPRHRTLRASGALAIAATALAVPVGALELAGRPLRDALDPGTWTGTVTSASLTVLALTGIGVLAAYWWHTRGRGSWTPVAALGAASLAVAAPVLIGHSMAFGPQTLMLAADITHLFAGAIWTGGLAALIATLHQTRRGRLQALPAARIVARFSTWAGVTVALLGASGVAMAMMIHPDWTDLLDSSLLDTDHGRALLVKLALVAIALALAGWNRWRLVPRIRSAETRSRGLEVLRRLLFGEAAILLLTIAVTGVLVNLSPEPDPEPTEPAGVTQVQELGTGQVEAVLTPGAAGTNTLTLHLTDAEGLALEPVEDPMVFASLPEQEFGPLQSTAEPTGEPGAYATELHLPLPGAWELEIHVRVSEFEHHMTTLVADLP
ncbi:copper resistance protein CopC [Glycomyces sp. NRRL B-16210]|uniref:copper resistance CopC/CopD family protein n=1 Tax=Glycomyces sp. NRRL B-16210 TaxID=1463821 RepID=UPI0004C1273B|nr:copper resistance protein CopC [Glycomyces sp. NRRL B-16210]